MQMFKTRPLIRAIMIFLSCWVLVIVLLCVLYFGWLRNWQMAWGATDLEVRRCMAGDELSNKPEFNATRAVHINATPQQVWPWIVQMGSGRGGFYNFDHLDNKGMPSAERIISEYQDLKVGDLILPLLQVVEIKPYKSMLWVFLKGAGGWENATWSWGLYKTENGSTRLITRLRQKYTFHSLQGIVMWGFQDVTEIFMMRTSLLRIKRRVEEYNKKNLLK